MKTTIVGRQLNVYDDTRSMIGLKLGKLDKYFPPHFSAVQREKVIIGLLEEWQSRKDGE